MSEDAGAKPVVPFIELTEVVEVAPHEAGYRQYKAADALRIDSLVNGGIRCMIGDKVVFLDAEQRSDLRTWLNG